MTREELEQYHSKRDEIEELKYKLRHLGEGDSMIGSDVIKDYRTGYPIPQSVVGYDYERKKRLDAMYRHRIEKLEKECREVDEFVESISDSLTRRIFRMYYLDNLSQEKVAKKVHVAQSVVSEKISNLLKFDKNDKKV